MHKITVVLLGVLAVSACGGPATPAPDQVSKLVEKAVQATLAAQPTQAPAPAVTAIPPSLATATSPAPVASVEKPVTVRPAATSTVAPTDTPAPTSTPAPTDTPTVEPTATPTRGPEITAGKPVNLRAGPGTNYPVVGTTKAGQTYSIRNRNTDGTWFEICCIDQRTAWVSASVVSTAGDMASVQIARNIPTPPPTPTPKPIPTSMPLATPAPVAAPPTKAAPQRAGLHTRQSIGTWEVQAERVQNEKAVYEYDDSKVAMGRYAIVFVLAKNLASGTQSIGSTLAPALRDDKGRIYDFSDPLTTERWAMIYATWEFSVGKTVFSDIDPGVETPLLMLWDVKEDVQSLSLILTDGRNKVEWDLGNFSNIPPYKPQ